MPTFHHIIKAKKLGYHSLRNDYIIPNMWSLTIFKAEINTTSNCNNMNN